MSITLAELATRIGAEVVGDGTRRVRGVAPIDRAGPEQVTFLANARYAEFLASTNAAAVIVGRSVDAPAHLVRLVADDPYFAFREALVALHGFRTHPPPMDVAGRDEATPASSPAVKGVSPRASVHPEASIGPECAIHPLAVVERGARIGRACVLYPGAYVGEHATLGDECVLFPHAVVYDRCRLGHRVTLHAGTVIGSDGFGYATHRGRHEKIPQAGIVVVEDDVEIGSGCVIERAALEETRIGAGSKLADLISIGHGTRIGRGCLIVSLVGISGSVDVGDFVAFGGQAGVAGHLSIGSQTQVAAKAAVVTDIPPGSRVAGIPAIDLDAAKRNALAGRDLYGMARRLKELEREVARLRALLGERDAEASTRTTGADR